MFGTSLTEEYREVVRWDAKQADTVAIVLTHNAQQARFASPPY